MIAIHYWLLAIHFLLTFDIAETQPLTLIDITIASFHIDISLRWQILSLTDTSHFHEIPFHIDYKYWH